MTDKICDRHVIKKYPYVASFRIAARRQKNGEKQVQCPECSYWLWPDEVGEVCEATGPDGITCLLGVDHKQDYHEANGIVW